MAIAMAKVKLKFKIQSYRMSESLVKKLYLFYLTIYPKLKMKTYFSQLPRVFSIHFTVYFIPIIDPNPDLYCKY